MAQHDDVQQRRDAKKAKLLAKKEKVELDLAVQGLLGTGQGRRYLYWLLEMTGAIGVNPFTGDAFTTAFRCGEQNVGQRIMAHVIEVSAVGFTTMLTEREAERQSQAQEQEQRDEDSTGNT